METALKEPANKVLVHCAAGVSRSGAFCVAYMIKSEGMVMLDALALG